jgi:sugar/nucleoside kinase (ribokinase family)
MTSKRLIKYIAIGQIHNEFIIDSNGRASYNPVGGSLVYSAAALSHWGGEVGLIGVIGKNFQDQWKQILEEKGLDTLGIKVFPQDLDLRIFHAYNAKNESISENPVAVYSTRGLTFPKELLGFTYDDEFIEQNKLNEISKILLTDFPIEYLDASAAHICPLNFTSQIQFSTLLLKGAVRTITIQPHHAFMNPAYWDDFPVLVKDATAIITCENELSSLFRGRSTDKWEMMEEVTKSGCKFVVLKQNSRGYSLFDVTNLKKYHIPFYPAKIVDPTGQMDAFCGGFLAGFLTSYDPVEAGIQGSMAASISGEHTGPFSICGCLPESEKARMDVIRDMTSQV